FAQITIKINTMNVNYFKTLWRNCLVILLFCFGLTSVWGQVTESFDSTTFPPTNWVNDGTIRTTNNARTGSACLGFNGAGDNITSPLVSNPENLSFWYRRSSNSATWGLKIEVLNSSNTVVATLPEIQSSTTTYQEYTADLSQYNNIKIRLTDTRGSGT